MNNNTNEEKLRILKERLSQIKEKEENAVTQNQHEEVKIQTNSDKFDNNKSDQKEDKESSSFKWLKYIVIIGILGYAIFYFYNINSLKLETTNTTLDTTNKLQPPALKYNLNLIGNNIAIIASLEEENSAKALVNDLKIKGFKCNYFFLPDKSNRTDKVFKVYIGPYENIEETNQWGENLKVDLDIIIL